MAGLILCTALVLAGADQSAAANPLAEQVTRLVVQLGARGLGERDQAERKLLELGPAALPLLPTVDEHTSAEVVQRLARIEQRLLTAQANAAAASTLITLKGNDLPLGEVLGAISRQTGNFIVDHRNAFGQQTTDVRIKADFDKVPYWRAMDEVLDQGNLTLYGFSGVRGAFVVKRPSEGVSRATRASYAGVFRLEPARFEAARDLRNGRERSLKFFFEIAWEPRLQPITILQPLGQVRATVGNEPIAVTNADAVPETPIRQGISAAELEVPLALPQRSVEKISSLAGKLVVLVPGPLHDFHFTALPVGSKNAQRVEQRQAGATVTIDEVYKNNAVWGVSLRVKFDSPSTALESHRGWILENEAFFQNAAGERFVPGGYEQTRQTREEVGLTYFFDLKERPDKLDFIYRTPVTILEMDVNYEFHNLDLP